MTATAASPARALLAPELQRIPLAQLHESPLNPRKLFDQAKLAELASSLKAKGQLTPALVRPNASGYELAAGHRRFRAAKLAGLTDLLCVVRPMEDADFLEVLVIENDQREDVHPLEEARGYRALLECKGTKYDIERIASRVGRSPSYVYDRLKLLQLIKPLQELFLAGLITAGHAVILARLAPSDQERVLGSADEAFGDGGLFEEERRIFETPEVEREITEARKALRKANAARMDLAELVRVEQLKPVSVRQLQSFVNDRIRIDLEAKDFGELFPMTAAAVKDATRASEKVVMITREFTIADEARTDEKVIGPRSWMRADGEPDDDGKATRTCEHGVLGVVAIGPGRAESFTVCIAKEKCAIHWPHHVRAAKQRAKKAKAASNGKPAPAEKPTKKDKWELAEEKRRQQEARDEAERDRWRKATPQLMEALAAAIKRAPAGASSAIATAVIDAVDDEWNRSRSKAAEKYLSRGKSAEDVLRFAALIALSWNQYNVVRDAPKTLKIFGLDAKKIVDAACPPAPKAVQASGKKKGKK